MNKRNIKKALDSFENDKYTDARDLLKKEIRAKRDEYLKDKLNLKNIINEEKK